MPPPNAPQQQVPLPQKQDAGITQLMVSRPGITRDGTKLARQTYTDGQWCRWYQNLPRKMLGYREIVRNVDSITRSIDIFTNSGYSFIHLGTAGGITRLAINTFTNVNTGTISRTPAAYVTNANINWQIDTLYDQAGGTTMVFANPSNNLVDISSQGSLPVFYGDAVAAAVLIPIPAGVTSSGGICAVAPYLFIYGHNGQLLWSVPGNPLDFAGIGSGSSRPCSSKIVRGLPLRGSSAPGIILWALDALVTGQYVGGTTLWNFTSITTNGSILSSNGVVEHNGIYYWASTSGFSIFNGVMRDLPNDTNRQWFLDNLNFAQRQKVFAVKVPRWNEIWWCFPYGTATECTHAVIYNITYNCWYDTILPNAGRSAGKYDVVYAYPIMAGTSVNSDTSGMSLWQHEMELDEISGAQASAKAIQSYYETSELSLVEPQQLGQVGSDQAVAYSILEPDFDQSGPLSFSAISRANARASEVTYGPVTIPEDSSDGNQLVNFKVTGRLTRFRLESNVVGGNYVTGSPVIHFKPSDGRRED